VKVCGCCKLGRRQRRVLTGALTRMHVTFLSMIPRLTKKKAPGFGYPCLDSAYPLLIYTAVIVCTQLDPAKILGCTATEHQNL
jgi:hypothetical protein